MYIAVIAIILGAWIGFANPFLHFPPFALLVPAGLAWMGRTAASPKKAFFHGFWAASMGYAGCMYWLVIPVHYYGGMNWLLSIPCPILIGMYLAAYAGLFSLATFYCRSFSPLLLGLFCGVGWASIEALRTFLFTGFPWLSLASAFSPWPLFIQGASVVGGIGLGVIFTSIAVWFTASGWRLSVDKAVAVCAISVVLVFGYQTIDNLPKGKSATACVVQGNIDQSLKWDPQYQNGTVERYITLSEGAVAKQKTDFIVWPETALPFYLQDINSLGSAVRTFVREKQVPLVTGTPAYIYHPQAHDYTLYNRAYLISPHTAQMEAYDKVHLLPFGEYMPLAEYIPFKKLVESVGDFAPGHKQGPLLTGNLALGILICYEAIFPKLAQIRVDKGSNVLVNISNDAWFGRSSAPLQHLFLSSLRAVEQERWLVRSTNTGISAFISPKGQIFNATDTFTATAATRKITLLDTVTFFHRNYQTVRLTIFTSAALLFLFGIATRRREHLR
ncbi:MAG: apolipoprotein N-acyltransferase [Desulfovibrio sp.]|uniref:apolipoprotein N-acyltransferase n=1 Tax=Desulfovibrio sp. 7SRBS1 TaxID=3378064 RepID=UPI003B3C45B7